MPLDIQMQQKHMNNGGKCGRKMGLEWELRMHDADLMRSVPPRKAGYDASKWGCVC